MIFPIRCAELFLRPFPRSKELSTVSIYRNWPARLCWSFVWHTVEMPCNKTTRKWKNANTPVFPMYRFASLTETHVRNCSLEAAICFLNPLTSGLKNRKRGPESSFKEYPDIKIAYGLSHSLRMIFSKNTVKDAARLSMARWYNKVEAAGMK